MSLINDALKKAQQARADQTLPPAANVTPATKPLHVPVPESTTPNPSPINRPPLPEHPPIVWRDPNSPRPAPTKPSSIRYESEPPRKKGSLPIFWLSLGAIAVIAISVRLTVMFTRSEAEPTATNKSVTVTLPRTEPPASSNFPQAEVPLPAPTLAVQLPLMQPAATPAPEPTPVATALAPEPAPTITFPAKSATPAPVTPTPAAPVATTVTATPATTPAAAAPAATVALPSLYAPRAPAPVNPGTRIQSFIDRLRVSGIRMSTTGSKVILNDRLFKAGEMVDTTLDLRLVKIEEGILTFTDANGKTYIKLFQ